MKYLQIRQKPSGGTCRAESETRAWKRALHQEFPIQFEEYKYKKQREDHY